MDFRFEILHQSKKSHARVGRIYTPHGIVDTPNFVGVGTNGTIKGLDNQLVDAIGLQLMFCNTYHLMLQPGSSLVRQAGGLHAYINRSMPLITDSGGFQVFSLAYGSVADELKSRGMKKQGNGVLKITEEGVLFRSYIDGARVLLTPETSIAAQKDLGADMIVTFDELPPYHIGEAALKNSFERTHRWQKRSFLAHKKDPRQQALYAVVHGGVDWDLRRESCRLLAEDDYEGFAIGGSLGKTKQQMYELLHHTTPHLPKEKPNHLLGIGDLASVEVAVTFGIDTLDSSYPTKMARHGVVLTHEGTLKLTKGSLKNMFSPISSSCSCYTCKNYSVAYLHHLFKAKELVAYTLATIHNLTFMVEKMHTIRQEILDDRV